MNQPWRMGLFLVVLVVGIASLLQGQQEAARWKELPSQFLDQTVADTDGMTLEQVHTVEQSELSADADLWNPVGGKVSLMVLNDRLKHGQWWRALAMCQRLQRNPRDSTVAVRARQVEAPLASGLLEIGVALVGGLLYWRRRS
jgi:hypothetical protein